MDGPGYFLFENRLAEFVANFNIDGLSYESATIWHRELDQEYVTHVEISVQRYFVPEHIHEFDLEGLAFYAMYDCYLFVSPALKEVLSNSPFDYLQFSEGLSFFGGID